jgi:hypothetical protein
LKELLMLIIILRNPSTDCFQGHPQKLKNRLFSTSSSSSETQEQIVFNLILILRNPRKDCFQPHPHPQKPEHRLFYLLKSSRRRRKTEYNVTSLCLFRNWNRTVVTRPF